MKILLLIGVLVLSGCAGRVVYVPQCEAVHHPSETGPASVTMKVPCYGYSNGVSMGPDDVPLMREGRSVYQVLIVTDERGTVVGVR